MDETFKLTKDSGGSFHVVGRSGERVSLALEPGDVHDPSELPTYLAGYKPFGFRADEASTPILVNQDEDKFRNFSSDDAFRQVVVKGSTQGAIPEVDPKSSLDSFKVVERYIGSFIPAQTQANASNPNYDPRMAAGRRCRWALDLDREVDLWSLLGTAGTWAASVQTVAALAWNVAGGDPIFDIQTAIEKSFQPVTAVWLNQRVAHTFLRNPLVRDHMRQMLGDQAVAAAVGNVANAGNTSVDFQIPGLPPIRVVASKLKNETTGALNYTLSDDSAVLLTTPPATPVSGEEIASTYTFRRRGPSGVGVETREFFVDGRGPLGGTMVVVSMADIAKMTANNAGGIITNVYDP
jgi:hypothetical protein